MRTRYEKYEKRTSNVAPVHFISGSICTTFRFCSLFVSESKPHSQRHPNHLPRAGTAIIWPQERILAERNALDTEKKVQIKSIFFGEERKEKNERRRLCGNNQLRRRTRYSFGKHSHDARTDKCALLNNFLIKYSPQSQSSSITCLLLCALHFFGRLAVRKMHASV